MALVSPLVASVWALLVSLAWGRRSASTLLMGAALVAALMWHLFAMVVMQAVELGQALLDVADAGTSSQSPPSACTCLTSLL